MVVVGGREEQREYVRQACLMSHEEVDANEEYVDLVAAACRWSWGPWNCEGDFDFGDVEYLRCGLDLYARVTKTGKVRLQPFLVLFNRSLFGGIGLLQRLGAHVPVGDIIGEERSRRASA